MKKLFFDCHNSEDIAYKNICLGKSKSQKNIKQFCESLWDKYKNYADSHFLSEIQKHFYDRFWEMYLTVTFLEIGYSIESSDKGPDILINYKNNKIWIEAVNSSNGIGLDIIPDVEFDAQQLVPEDKIILRLRTSIEIKLKAYERYACTSIIKVKEPYIIALNSAGLNFMTDDDIPYILKALLPIGDYVYNFKDEIMKIEFRDRIIKEKGSEVFTNIFFNDRYKYISAIIYSNVSVHDFNADLGSDFILIHNPTAINPLPIDLLKKGKIITIDMNKENNTFEIIGLK